LSQGLIMELDNELAEIGRFNEAFEAFAATHALSAKNLYEVTLAVEELLTNIITHGFPQGGRHKILVALDIEEGRLTARLVDDGIAFNPLTVPAPDLEIPLEERGIGGLGVHFVRKAMDSLDYRRENGQNQLVMTKRVTADPLP